MPLFLIFTHSRNLIYTLPTVDTRIISLGTDVRALLQGTGSREQLEAVVAVCHALALTHLRAKASAWKMMDFHGLTQSDLAYDCVGDLFRQDENGCLGELVRYFEPLGIELTDSAGILVHLRRLVFAKVNTNLSRLIAETDSFFFRTMRNIRNAVANSTIFEEVDRFGSLTLVPRTCDPLWNLPAYPDDEFAQVVWSGLRGAPAMPALMKVLHSTVCRQDRYCRTIPLLHLVTLIKEASEQQHRTEASGGAVETVDENAARELIAEARDATARKFRSTYVEKGKVSQSQFTSYLNAIEKILMIRIAEGEGTELSLFTSLRTEIGGLSEEQYRSVHRTRVEYMARFMHQRIAEQLKKN
jgi:hypothetical protein